MYGFHYHSYHRPRDKQVEREQAIIYWMDHCRSCGQEAYPLLVFESRILGSVGLCQDCCDKSELHPGEFNHARYSEQETK